MSALLSRLARAPSGFTCAGLSPVAGAGVRARYRGPRGGFVDLVGAPGPGRIAFERCHVRYAITSPELVIPHRDAVKTLVAALGEALDAWLDVRALDGWLDGVEADRAPVSHASVTDRLRGWLDPGDEGPGGVRFVGVDTDPRATSIMLRTPDGAALGAVVRADLEPRVELVGARDPALVAWLQFALRARGPWHPAPAVAARPQSWFVRGDSWQPDGELMLVLNGPCRQACAFCSIPARLRHAEVDDATAGEAVAAVARAAAHGATRLRLTGIDPLWWPGLMDLVGAARSRGMRRLDIHSPSARFADRAFLDRFLAVAPPGVHVNVPLYGVAPDVHDAIVHRPGAHAEVVQAIDQLVARIGADAVSVTTVVLRENLAQIGALFAWTGARRLSLMCQLPFPDSESPDDLFHRVALPQSEVASALLAGDPPLEPAQLLRISGLLPCVVAEAARRHSPAAARAMLSVVSGPAVAPLPNGFRTPEVACPHASGCALADRCGGRVLGAYLQKFGDRELQPA